MLKNIARFYIPSIISFVLGLVSAIVLTRVFEPSTYGTLNIFNNFAALLLSFSYIGMDATYIRFYNEPPEKLNQVQLCNLLLRISFLTFTVLFTGLFFAFGSAISEKVFGFYNLFVIISLYINVISQLILRYYLVTYRMQLNTFKYSLLTVITQIVIRFTVLIAALFHQSITIVILCNSIGVFVEMLIICIVYKEVIFCHNIIKIKDTPKELVNFGIFAAPIPIISNLNAFLSQQIIKYIMDVDQVGIYASANYFVTLFSVLQSGFTTFWSAFVYANYKEKQKDIAKVHDYVLLAIIGVYYCFIIFRDLFYIIIGEDYHDSKVFFAAVIFYPMLILLAETTSYGIQIAKKNYYITITNGFVMLFNLLCGFFLTKKIGLSGAAISSAFSGILYYAIVSIIGQRFYSTISNIKKSLMGTSILVLMLTFSFINDSLYKNVIITILVIIALFIYRNELIYLKNSLKNYLKNFFKGRKT